MNKEDFKKQVEAEHRDDTDSGGRVEDTAPEQTFEDHLTDTLAKATENSRSKIVTANSPPLWALLETLDGDTDRRTEFFENIDYGGAVGDEDDMNRSAVLKHLVQLALEEHDPELIGALETAKSQSGGKKDIF